MKSKEASQIYSLNDDKLFDKLKFEPIKPKSPSIKYSLSFIKKLLEKTGLLFILRKYYVSEDLLNWINNLKPDIILTMLGDLATMDFAIEIKNQRLNWQFTFLMIGFMQIQRTHYYLNYGVLSLTENLSRF